MRVFFSWLIANLEIAMFIAFIPLIYFVVDAHPDIFNPDGTKSVAERVFIGSVLILIAGGVPNTKVIYDIICLVFSYIGAICIVIECSDSISDVQLIAILASGLLAATVIGVYAWRNFYDMVSLRWLFSNSNATKFEVSFSYAVSRFCLGFHLGTFTYVLLYAICC